MCPITRMDFLSYLLLRFALTWCMQLSNMLERWARHLYDCKVCTTSSHHIASRRVEPRSIDQLAWICLYRYVRVQHLVADNGVNTNGAAAKVTTFDGLGKKVRPGTFGKMISRLTGVPQKSLCQKT